ncbi:hypothetical protein QQ045_000455 [Rhodiola kirilowii]
MDDRVIIETKVECKEVEGEDPLDEGSDVPAPAPILNIPNNTPNTYREKDPAVNPPNIIESVNTESFQHSFVPETQLVKVRSEGQGLGIEEGEGEAGFIEVTKIKDVDKFSVARSWCPTINWDFFCFRPSTDGKSRILLLWNPEVIKVNICDFNCILSQEEKLNDFSVGDTETKELRYLFDNFDLHDLPSGGNWFTWCSRKIDEARIWCKLDRILINSAFSIDFPSVEGLFSDYGISDYCPAIVKLSRKSCRNSWFRFQTY